MATSFADFSGAKPRHYDECLGPVMFEPYAVDLARRVPHRVLARGGPSALEFARGMMLGTPLCHQLTERSADLETATREVARAVALVGGSAPFTLDLAATVVTAIR
jgi:hypothetical protein